MKNKDELAEVIEACFDFECSACPWDQREGCYDNLRFEILKILIAENGDLAKGFLHCWSNYKDELSKCNGCPLDGKEYCGTWLKDEILKILEKEKRMKRWC